MSHFKTVFQQSYCFICIGYKNLCYVYPSSLAPVLGGHDGRLANEQNVSGGGLK